MSIHIGPGVRRRVILAGGAAVGVSAIGAIPAFAAAGYEIKSNPFTLGVASGDPDWRGVVLWTRLAPDPLAEDGKGGMPDRSVSVSWEIAADSRFRRVVRRGSVDATPAWGHSVHIEADGLAPGHEYWYRFKTGTWVSPAGRTRTAPPRGSMPKSLDMAFVSCSQYEHGYFTAYRRMAEDHPDIVLHLGDYQYEYKKDTYTIPGGNIRDHEGPETETLANYRQRHAQYKTDPDLQVAHAAAPWVVVFDDHELDNNWADEIPEHPEIPQPNFLERRKAAFRAYYENMPLRRTSVPQGIDMQIYRRLNWGRLATFHMLDTRQFRDDQACGDGYQDCPAADDPARSITGGEQEAWLLDGLNRSSARWDVLGQQVFFGQRDNTDGPVKKTSMDGWDGYTASRRRITEGWIEAGVRNPVVLTGDVHSHWASDLKLDYDDPTGETVGSELVCSSITSGGDGADSNPADHPMMRLNPHLRFFNGQRGYVRTRITPGELKADFRVVPMVSATGSAAHTKATFVIEDGVAGPQQTYLRPLSTDVRATGEPPSTDGFYGDGADDL
ncbi:alkaline phosphatase D family protein [Phytomonospora endophytica]|uniref:Alkaline phosphatase D n=1 Tax=Phytomonospora endophytica TaxID=714109 RepID=A0A841G0C2_9ACTN|nr:alkaline phosphatase D family protein [Phytomonospora endophytica]MBB6039222.1 alkaline phosphatase D [Phytomonospora endophytica]GIG67541.1 alkaline phosphatase [Phytomonospora endophytica]